MTGFQARRTPQPPGPPTGLAKRLVRATTLAACAALVAGCGVIPGTTGGTGDGPITVMTWAPEKTAATNKPGMPAMAKAYARWINAGGGINGRELKILTCNDHNDTVTAAKCARRAADEDVVAVVGSYSQHGRSFLAPLESAGIPYIGGYGVTDDEFASALSYPVNGGQASLMAGLGEQLAEDCGPVALVRPDSIAGDQLPLLLDSGLRSRGHGGAEDQLAAEDATEYGGHAREALRRASTRAGTEGCVVPALGDRTFTFMDSFRRDRADFPEVRTGTVLGSVDQTVIDATGGRSGPYEGAYVTGWYPVESDKRWDRMKEVIREHAFGDNRIDPADPGVQTTWIAYTVLTAALEKIGDGEVTSQAIRRVLDGGLKVTTGGLTPPLSWRFEDLIASAGFPRLINPEVTFQIVRKGQLVAARRDFVNVEKTLVEAEN
ncbi:ABC transporter substrate-binding protein [Streptomyces caniscabiei]|uniref:ABC transporter substrate-binding protein n=1 Tax=Streptomyces caniscabiei TaxID=2746961 RepID=A0A927L403_9ACTN|nr:ABC transporter substrate-binding protein [Streptomyces caniscabiei]MBD9725012.1 ABC transporter substrate-binding protein [Streptomyces caniscabiei]MDX3510416.1 ABC transporter substrate-binding protein [Streptomyces caniscabiei]MDX3720499.1 ABC transporter substrate-binding protein [Streptomyces caniscabiei]WEO26207.1 ABC transporter substrate-binding protein [Streptomyces caniscabiei]